MRRRSVGLFAVVAAVLAGCGGVPDGASEAAAYECPLGEEGCDDNLPIGPGGNLDMDMGDFFFDVTGGTPVTGEILVTVDNVSDQYHNAEFLGAAEGSDIPEAAAREAGDGTVLLFPGEWTVICNVPGHRAAGMETTITVYATEEDAAAAAEEADEAGEAGDAGTDLADESDQG